MKKSKAGQRDSTGTTSARPDDSDSGRPPSRLTRKFAVPPRVFPRPRHANAEKTLPAYASGLDDDVCGDSAFDIVDHGCLTVKQVSDMIAGQTLSKIPWTTDSGLNVLYERFHHDDDFNKDSEYSRQYCSREETVMKAHELTRPPGQGRVAAADERDPLSLLACRCQNSHCSAYLDAAVDFLAKARENAEKEFYMAANGKRKTHNTCVYERVVMWLAAVAAGEEEDVDEFNDLRRNSCDDNPQCIRLNIFESDQSKVDHRHPLYLGKQNCELASKRRRDQILKCGQKRSLWKNPKCRFTKGSSNVKIIPIKPLKKHAQARTNNNPLRLNK